MSTRSIVCAVLLASALAAQGGPPSKVAVVPVVRRAFRPMLEVLGSVRSPRMSRASAEIDGLVTEVPVVEGQRVTPETVIARLDTRRLEIEKREAEAQVRLAAEQLAELRAGSRPEDVAEARAAVIEARAQYEEAQRELERAERLRRTDAASEQEFTAARARAAAAEALWRQREARRDRVVAGPRKEEIARAEAQVAVRRAELDALIDDLEKAVIRAPFAGVVTQRTVERGAFVRRGDPLVEVVQLDPVWVELDVPEGVVREVSPGVELEVVAPAEGGEMRRARVSAVVPIADVQARTFPVRLEIANPDGRLLPGMTARARVPFGEGRDAMAVPRDALVPGAEGTVVFVVRDGIAAAVPVRPGAGSEGSVPVEGPLREGEPVVVRGNERLRPGQPVQVVREGADGSAR